MREKSGVLRADGSARVIAMALVFAVSAGLATAQEIELRGNVSEDEITATLLSRDGVRPGQEAEVRQDVAPEPYIPVSEGALPETESGTDPARAGAAEDDPAPADDPFASDGLFTRSEPAGRVSVRERRRQPENEPRRASSRTGGELDGATEPEGEAEDEDVVEATASVRQPTIDSLDEEANSGVEAENPRTDAIEGRDFELEEEPYAPLGLRLGTFDVNATLEQGLRWTTNVDSSPTGEEALLSETQLRLQGSSDWSRHAARFSAYGTFLKSVSGADYEDPEGGFDAALDFDLGGGYSASAGLNYSLRPESASSPVIIVGTASQPLRHIVGGNLGFAKNVGKLRLAATGTVEREIFSDAELSGGGTLSQEERNSTLATIALRTGYEVSPALIPFAEVELGRRFYDLELDSSGYARSADRLALRGGVAFDFGEKLTGEISAGWLRETFDDTRLEAVSGPSVAAELSWSPERGTVVTLTGSTLVEGTTTAGESGSVLYSGLLGLSREVRANVLLEASLGADYRDYVGSADNETTLRAQAGATWWLNRHVGITGNVRHETFESTLPDRDWQATSVFLGLRLQR
ncbi:outer membrane beta-barrel protein [Nitratireductor mangrovi]|nr:outer membrane beta-barrel protein [Nitratireductor mangrovi]